MIGLDKLLQSFKSTQSTSTNKILKEREVILMDSLSSSKLKWN